MAGVPTAADDLTARYQLETALMSSGIPLAEIRKMSPEEVYLRYALMAEMAAKSAEGS